MDWQSYLLKVNLILCIVTQKGINKYYQTIADNWNSKLDNNEISIEEYYANSPCGYECWSCSYCGKWTGNFKYN